MIWNSSTPGIFELALVKMPIDVNSSLVALAIAAATRARRATADPRPIR